MASADRSSWRALVATALVCVTLAGCSDEDSRDASPAAEPQPSTTASGEVVGEPTSSDSFPQWEAIDTLEVPRDDFGAAVVGDEIWTMGGMTGERGNRLVSIEILDTTTQEWRTSEVEMPVGLASFEMVAIGQKIYAFGGFDKDSDATAFSAVLDTRTGRWRDLPALPHARYAHTVTRYRGDLYVIGGRDGDGTVDAVDVFDPRSETWTTAQTPMPRARDSHDTVATPDGLMVLGGWADVEPTDQVDVYDPRSDTWSEGPALPEPMSRAGVTYTDGQVWASYHELSYVLDVTSEQWTEANALPLARHGLGYVPLDGAIYAIGGCALNPLRDVRTVDRLELS